MTDHARRKSEKALKELERRIRYEYSQAAKEVEQKLRNHLDAFAVKDREKLSQLSKGLITKKDYEAWKTGQLMTGERWRALQKELTYVMNNADRVAAGMIHEHMKDVYAMSRNFGEYQIDRALGAHLRRFTLYDKSAVERLLRRNPQILPNPSERVLANVAAGRAELWTKRQVQSVMLQSIVQGESIPKIAKRMRKDLGESYFKEEIKKNNKKSAKQMSRELERKNRNAAIRNARTMTTCAENAGRFDSYIQAESMGVSLEKTWLATDDNRTRKSHREIDGETVPIKEEFSNGLMYPADPMGAPEEVYNCFVGETIVATDSEVVRSYKHKYDGELITIKTAAGVEFTCTPNHPILTPLGWVSANRLHKGDDIAVTFVGDSKFSRRDPNINHVHTRIDAVHKFANIISCERAGRLCVNFHGDIPTSDVEIVAHKRLLKNDGHSSVIKSRKEFLFKFSYTPLFRNSTLMEYFRSIGKTTLCFIRRTGKTLTFLERSLLHAKKHGLRPIALLDANGMEPMDNNIAGHSKFFRKRFNGTPTIVFLDKIIDVDQSSKCTHVYNLQTENGYYFVNSIITKKTNKDNGIVAIAHNCRCTLTAEVNVAETAVSSSNLLADAAIAGMAYEEWEEMMEDE